MKRKLFFLNLFFVFSVLLQGQIPTKPDSSYYAEMKIYCIVSEMDKPLKDALPEMRLFMRNQYADFNDTLWRQALKESQIIEDFYQGTAKIYFKLFSVDEIRELIKLHSRNDELTNSDVGKKIEKFKITLTEQMYRDERIRAKKFMQTLRTLYMNWKQTQKE